LDEDIRIARLLYQSDRFEQCAFRFAGKDIVPMCFVHPIQTDDFQPQLTS